MYKYLYACCAIAVGGCAQIQPDHDINAVNAILREHGATEVSYHAQDGEIHKKITELLAKPLNPDDAVRIAVLNNRHLATDLEGLGISQADYAKAATLANPVLDLNIKFVEGGGTKFEFSIIQSFFDLIRLPQSRKIASAEFEAAKLRIADIILNTSLRARQAMIHLQSAEARKAKYATLIESFDAQQEISQRIHDAGNSNALQLATETEKVDREKMELADAELMIVERREALTRVLGLQFSDSNQLAVAPLDTNLPMVMDGSQAEQTAIKQSLQLAAMGQDMIAYQQKAKLAGDTSFAAGIAAEHEAGTLLAGPGISVPLPIFSQGQAQKLRSQSIVEQLRQNRYATEQDIRSSIHLTSALLTAKHMRVQHYLQTVIPLHKTIYQETLKQYNGMLVDVFHLLQARRQQLQADIAQINALEDFWITYTTYVHIISGGQP